MYLLAAQRALTLSHSCNSPISNMNLMYITIFSLNNTKSDQNYRNSTLKGVPKQWRFSNRYFEACMRVLETIFAFILFIIYRFQVKTLLSIKNLLEVYIATNSKSCFIFLSRHSKNKNWELVKSDRLCGTDTTSTSIWVSGERSCTQYDPFMELDIHRDRKSS